MAVRSIERIVSFLWRNRWLCGNIAPLTEYNISASGIMVLCKACDKYLQLLHGELHLVQKEQDDEQDVVKAMIAFCSEPKSAKESMEKFAFPNRLYLKRHFLDEMLMNKRKLSKEEKETIKLAIDQANNLNELLQVAFASLAIDAHR